MSTSNGQVLEEVFSMTEDEFPTEALQSNVIIRPCEAEAVSEGGIIIPDSVKERPNKGWIVSMGEDLANKPIKVGTLIYHVKGAGVEIEYNKVPHFIMRYTDCLCYDKKTGKYYHS